MKALYTKISDQYSHRKPFVVYALPDSNKAVGLFQKDEKDFSSNDLLESGFVFAPFDGGENRFIPNSSSEILEAKIVSVPQALLEVKPPQLPEEKRNYKSLVASAIENIERTQLDKVVTSRSTRVRLKRWDLEVLVERLLSLYPDAFRYIWFHPDTGFWCGATPEILLTREDLSFQTMALAGTRKYDETNDPDWTPKEIQEQAMVVEAIQKKLETTASVIKVSRTVNHKAGSLVHLRTDFSGVLKKGGRNLIDIVNSLHPTPAVCGTPRDLAQDFIASHEGYDRSYYTGYLGPINSEAKQSKFYVNLRCMSLNESFATIYVGGGVVHASQPESEWEETQNKLQTMLQVLAPMLP
ncbi:MAG: isochorismate synthase [Bacteroidota bacterium]